MLTYLCLITLINQHKRQVIKQTTRSSDPSANPPDNVFLQCWQLIALALPCFGPLRNVVDYLDFHLARSLSEQNSQLKDIIGYCRHLNALRGKERNRKLRPSRQEVRLIMENDFNGTKLGVLRAQLPSGLEVEAEYDSLTTVSDVLDDICGQLSIRSSLESGVGLFLEVGDSPFTNVQKGINNAACICDIFSQWEGIGILDRKKLVGPGLKHVDLPTKYLFQVRLLHSGL